MTVFFPLRFFDCQLLLSLQLHFCLCFYLSCVMLANILSCTLPKIFSAKVTQWYHTNLGLGSQRAEPQDWGFYTVFLWLVISLSLPPNKFPSQSNHFYFLIAFLSWILFSVSPDLTSFQQKFFWAADDSVPKKLWVRQRSPSWLATYLFILGSMWGWQTTFILGYKPICNSGLNCWVKIN